jgi:ABC-type multidrug transport system fused ATPase/permease subunit
LFGFFEVVLLKKIFQNIIAVLSPKEKRKFFLLMILSLLVSIADILSLAFLFLVINFYTPQNATGNLSLFSNIGISKYSMLPAVLLLVAFIGKSLGGYYVFKAQEKFVKSVSSRISDTNILKYLEGSYEEHINIDYAVFVQRIYHHPIEFATSILTSVQQIITEFILVILAVIVLLIYSAKLLMIVALVLLPAVAILGYITKRRLSAIRNKINSVQEQSLQYLHEALTGFVESNIYEKNKDFRDRYSHAQSSLNNFITDLLITQGLPSRFFEAFAVFGLFILIVVEQSIGTKDFSGFLELGAFVAAAYKIIPGISRIINLSGMIRTYSYILPDLKYEADFVESEIASKIDEKLQSVRFEKVNFTYNDVPVLSDTSFNINEGSLTGISGDSGKGKTTIINLLLGFLKPQSGNILVNGKFADERTRKNYWAKVAYVKQEPFMLHDSILNNVTLFEKKHDSERLNKAIDISELKEIIMQFPEGIHKIISEGGKNISGGQRQRIAIARALYKDADVIILDEPFNELDESSELRLMQHLKSLSQKGKIIILITHNSDSLAVCDTVINLNE